MTKITFNGTFDKDNYFTGEVVIQYNEGKRTFVDYEGVPLEEIMDDQAPLHIPGTCEVRFNK